MSNIDSKIGEMFNVIQKRKAEIATSEAEIKEKWKTPCSITIGEQTTPQNIQVLKDVQVVKVVRELLIYREFTQTACKLLDVPYDDKYQNVDINDWIADCKKRLSVLTINEKKTQLAELEKRLDKIVSPDKRREMELESITKSLGLV